MAGKCRKTKSKKTQEPQKYHINRATRFYRDVPIQLENSVGTGCALDSDLFSRSQEMSQRFRQMEDIILLSLDDGELSGQIERIEEKHLVKFNTIDMLKDSDGIVSLKALTENRINALFTDHTRIGRLDFVSPDHISSEIRRIEDYTYRHDSTIESEQGADLTVPSAWKLEAVDLNTDMVYWVSLEEYVAKTKSSKS